MILTKAGKLSAAQQVDSATAEDSTNVMMVADDSEYFYEGLEGAKLVIQNAVAASGSGTLTIDVVLARESTLDNNVSIARVYIAGVTDYRVVTAGAPIFEMEFPSWIGWLVKTIADANSSDIYLGIIYTPSSTAVYTLNAAITSNLVKQEDGAVKTQQVTSQIGVPGYCSAGS